MIENFVEVGNPPHEIVILCFGDEQEEPQDIRGGRGFDLEAWDAFVDDFHAFRRSTPNVYLLQLGDSGDFIRPTVRARLEGAVDPDGSARAQLDNLIRKHSDKIIERYCKAGFEGRFLGIHDGHHNWTFATGETITTRIVAAMRATNLGWAAGTWIRVPWPRDGRRASHKDPRPTYRGLIYTLFSTHGNANARKVPGAMTWVENNLASGFVADHIVCGHACKNGAWPPGVIKVMRRRSPFKFDNFTPKCLLVGGFHDGYTNGWESVRMDEKDLKTGLNVEKKYRVPKSTYIERSNFRPQPLMWGVIRLKIANSTLHNREHGLSKYTKVMRVTQYNQGPGTDLSVYESE